MKLQQRLIRLHIIIMVEAMRYWNTWCVHNTYWYLQIIHTCSTLCFMTIVYSPNSSTTVSDNTSLLLEDSPPNTTTTTREELMVMAVMVWYLLLIMLSSSTVTCGNVFIVFTDVMSIMILPVIWAINIFDELDNNFTKLLPLPQCIHMSIHYERHLFSSMGGLVQWCSKQCCCV